MRNEEHLIRITTVQADGSDGRMGSWDGPPFLLPIEKIQLSIRQVGLLEFFIQRGYSSLIQGG